ncbi:MAG TPA: thermonuclease family protein [Beijerinckiaceae bacterium]
MRALLRRPLGHVLLPLAAAGALAVWRLEPPPAARPPGVAAGAGAPLLAGPYRARVLRVIDGDTFEARLAVWLGHEVTTLVRLRGVDAPELNGRTLAERRAAAEARATLAELLAAGEARLVDVAPDKYNGRVVATALAPDGRGGLHDVAEALIAGGYARPYAGGRREPWPPRLESADAGG